MTKPVRKSPAASRIIEDLARVPRIETFGPIAARFVYSLRLIALHERAHRDPVPELTVRLGGVQIAAKSLALSHAITGVWPEDIHVSRFCCQCLTHDEETIAALVEHTVQRRREDFAAQIEGLIRPDREHRLWDAAFALVVAEMHAA
ncbi:MAG: DNA-directed RNA polymerase subunit beta' [Pseudomonadota bacterium]